MERATKRIALTRGNERYGFTYEVGDESVVLECIIAMVHRPDLAFDWFDAAMLSHQVGKHLAQELKSYVK